MINKQEIPNDDVNYLDAVKDAQQQEKIKELANKHKAIQEEMKGILGSKTYLERDFKAKE